MPPYRARRRPVRILAVTVLALALAPGTWLRSAQQETDLRPLLAVTPLDLPSIEAGPDMVAVAAWELSSENKHFGGYSALLVREDDAAPAFFAASDRGRFLRFDLRDGEPEFGAIAGSVANTKDAIDVEAVTSDPATGRLWFAYEGRNLIERRNASLGDAARAKPGAMERWGENSGPEAIVRLADGQFIVLSEGPRATYGTEHAALLFADDPVKSVKVAAFTFTPPSGYRPVDMAQLPDGRVLILVRRFIPALPPRFETKVLLADPQGIVAGGIWTGQTIATIAPPLPSDNYEGMDVVTRPDGGTDIWLIADDNLATFQRTLLLKLSWQPNGATATKRKTSVKRRLSRPSSIRASPSGRAR